MDNIKIEADAPEKFHGSVLKELGTAREERRRGDVTGLELEEIIRRHIIPNVPHTMYGCYRLTSVTPGYGYPMASFSLIFVPKLDMTNSEQAKVALGTVTKFATKLEGGGWEIVKHPQPHVYEHSSKSSGMTIILEISKELPPSMLDRLTRRGQPARTMAATLKFTGAHETDSCRLVEEEVTVKAQYIEEHKETRLKVVCDND